MVRHRLLWQEKQIQSVANAAPPGSTGVPGLGCGDPIRPEIQEYPLEEANRARVELKERRIRGAKVLRIA